jgi:uncharacterized membrane protein
MTDDQTTPATTETPVDANETIVITAEIADEHGVVAAGGVAIQGDHLLLVARFADTQTAAAVYDDLLNGEIAGKFHIDGVLVAKSDQGGNITIQKLTDHHTRRGLKWGVVAGVVAGIVFPPSILASAVVLGTAGAAAGKIGNVREKAKVEAAVADVLTPGTSGILALITLEDLPAVKETMPQAQEVKTIPVDETTAAAIEKAASDAAA